MFKLLKPNIYCKGKDYSNNKLDITGNIKKDIFHAESFELVSGSE